MRGRTERSAEAGHPACMPSPLTVLRKFNSIARVSVLREHGVSSAQLAVATRTGLIRQIRKGWVATASAPAEMVTAVSSGGRLACVSAARFHGLWVPENSGELHVGIPRHAGRTFDRDTGQVWHWDSVPWFRNAKAVESVEALVRQVVVCCNREDAVAIIDSALHARKLSHAALRRVIHGLPKRFGAIVDDVDPASESGLESICRLRLKAVTANIRSQVSIPGVGRVDLLVGDRLVIETDGREWHNGSAAFYSDRTRDLALARLGYVVIRVGYTHVMNEWMLVELAVRAIIERREHLWRAVHRRLGLAH
jgi:very-short-patch-repair endonuclease